MSRTQALLVVAVISAALLGLSAWMFVQDRGPAVLYFIVGLVGWLAFLLIVLVDSANALNANKPSEPPTINE